MTNKNKEQVKKLIDEIEALKTKEEQAYEKMLKVCTKKLQEICSHSPEAMSAEKDEGSPDIRVSYRCNDCGLNWEETFTSRFAKGCE